MFMNGYTGISNDATRTDLDPITTDEVGVPSLIFKDLEEGQSLNSSSLAGGPTSGNPIVLQLNTPNRRHPSFCLE